MFDPPLKADFYYARRRIILIDIHKSLELTNWYVAGTIVIGCKRYKETPRAFSYEQAQDDCFKKGYSYLEIDLETTRGMVEAVDLIIC
jgi:hypothetical protein